MEYTDENEIDMVVAPPDISVVGDEEGIDENDLFEGEGLLPDAAGLIKVHQTADGNDADPPQKTL